MKNALLRLHAAVFLWGFTGVLGRLITLNAGWLVWWRMLITAVSLIVIFGIKKDIPKISFRNFIKVGSVGFVLALHWLCFYGSIKLSNVSIALTCLSTSGLLSAIIEPLFFRRRINPSELALGMFALIGIGIIYFSNLHFSTGIYVGLLAAVLSVSVSVLNKKMINDFEPYTFTLYQLAGGFVGLTFLMPLYQYIFPTAHILPTSIDWLWLFIMAWVCTILTYFFYIRALKDLSAFTANLTLTLEPVYGIILAFVIYKENQYLSNSFYIGFALILMAVLLQMRKVIKSSKK